MSKNKAVIDGPFVHWFAYVSRLYISPPKKFFDQLQSAVFNEQLDTCSAGQNIDFHSCMEAAHPRNQRARHLTHSVPVNS
jgi:hypothetical protein